MVPLTCGAGDQFSVGPENDIMLDDIEDAIAVATTNLGLMPGVAFQARVLQLAHLNVAHKTVRVLCCVRYWSELSEVQVQTCKFRWPDQFSRIS